MENADLQWLLSHIPKSDTLGTKDTSALALTRLIKQAERKALPITMGLFGSWGSGKTTTLAYVAAELQNSNTHAVVYFNAWKYSGFTEVVPALIYRVLSTASAFTPQSNAEAFGRIMFGLGKKYAESIGSWSKVAIGIDLVELAKDARDVAKSIRDSSNPGEVLAREYYTQLDRAQDALASICRECSRTIVILIDELDRCDPGEAFEIVKELRVFFTMLNVPLIFVLAVNPEPIGQAIKHQFGLESEWGDYEARKILEKFVDQYFDIGDNGTIVPFVESLWSAERLQLNDSCFIARADTRLKCPDYNENTLLNASFRQCILGNNPIYGNRRLLAKCLERAKLSSEGQDLILTTWHLQIADQAYPRLRRSIAILVEDLRAIAEEAHLDLIRNLVAAKAIDDSSGTVVKGAVLNSEKGKTAFSLYRSAFWESSRKRLGEIRSNKDSQARLRESALQELMDDPRKMDFVVVGLMQPLGAIHGWQQSSQGFEVNKWRDLFGGSRLEYLLFNY
jgi:hypothetical protein